MVVPGGIGYDDAPGTRAVEARQYKSAQCPTLTADVVWAEWGRSGRGSGTYLPHPIVLSCASCPDMSMK